MKAIKIILFLYILTLFSACLGQDKVKGKVTQTKTYAEGKLVSQLPSQIWSIFQDEKDNYWFGSNGQGVFHYDGNNLKQFTENDGLIDDSIRGIQGDHLGNVYIQTPEGVSKYDGQSFTSLELSESGNPQWKLEPNDLWFNCNGNPNDIYRYDGEHLYELKLPRKDLNKAFGGEVRGLGFKDMNSSPYSVFGINKDKAGNLWIGTIVAGAFRYDGKSFLWIPEKELTTLDDGRVPGVRSMIEDKDGNVWLSNFISRYRINTKDSITSYEKMIGIDPSNEHFLDRIPYFNSGLMDGHGDLWMTTYGGGVWKYDGEKLSNFPLIHYGEEALMVSIYQDNKGGLWVGTNNVGAFKFNGKSFEKFIPQMNN